MATPTLRALREAHPDATITPEASPRLAPLYAGLDSFDRFLPAPRGFRASLERVRALRRCELGCAVLLPDSPRAALAAFLARTPRRIGHSRDPLRRMLLTESIPLPANGGRHDSTPMVDRYLSIVAALGCEARRRKVELAVDSGATERVSPGSLETESNRTRATSSYPRARASDRARCGRPDTSRRPATPSAAGIRSPQCSRRDRAKPPVRAISAAGELLERSG